MKRERKLPFDPKVFLSKVNGGRAISDYRKDQIVYTQGEPADSVFYIQSGKVKKTVISEQGKEAVVAILGTGDFFGEGCLTGQLLRLSTLSANDGMRDRANNKGRHHPRDPRRAGICRAIYRAPLGSQLAQTAAWGQAQKQR
ncbi:MAG: cyclic nucleotide-binding domain-containing protein [Xanthobacteraceae bacterium]